MLSLKSGGAVLDLLPEVGGAVSRFAIAGDDILRPAPPGASGARQTACFPLVPFFGRIQRGRFAFNGETVTLPPDPGFEPNALHGQGWRNAWTIAAHANDAATLAFNHPVGAWPWAYEARQHFTLMPESLSVELALVNRADRPMPYSLGLHPYFLRTPRTSLTAEVAGVWLADAAIIPTERAAPHTLLDLAHGASLAGAPFVDNCHFGWKHRAVIAQPDHGRSIELHSDADFLHIFLPRMENFFCAEPVTAMPDVFNRAAQTDSGFRVLDAGETATVAMTIAVRV